MQIDLETLREEHVEEVMATARTVVASEPASSESTGDSRLLEMCDYHLETGGKRLRAILPLAVAEALETPPRKLYPFAAACELLHNATLVHDDLQDGDELRRGALSVWREFGAEDAINLGDAMLYWPLLALQRLEVSDSLHRRCVGRFVRQTLAVIDGQQHEFELREADRPSREDYLRMVEGKTASLFTLTAAGAAELVGASARRVDALESAATHLGILFQIQDDVLDLYGDKGRGERGGDIREGKISVLVVDFIERAPSKKGRRLRRLLRTDREEVSSADVDEVAEMFRRTGSLEAALDRIEARRKAAVETSGLADHAPLRGLVSNLAELFTAPIEHLS